VDVRVDETREDCATLGPVTDLADAVRFSIEWATDCGDAAVAHGDPAVADGWGCDGQYPRGAVEDQ
jgi:hypothetical protein